MDEENSLDPISDKGCLFEKDRKFSRKFCHNPSETWNYCPNNNFNPLKMDGASEANAGTTVWKNVLDGGGARTSIDVAHFDRSWDRFLLDVIGIYLIILSSSSLLAVNWTMETSEKLMVVSVLDLQEARWFGFP